MLDAAGMVWAQVGVVLLQGYGFLSENAAFVDICGDHGIEFIGPTSKHISMMGDKSTARDTMAVRRTLPPPPGFPQQQCKA